MFDIRQKPANSPADTLKHVQHVQNGRANAHLTMLISAGPQRFLPLSKAGSHGQTIKKPDRHLAIGP